MTLRRLPLSAAAAAFIISSVVPPAFPYLAPAIAAPAAVGVGDGGGVLRHEMESGARLLVAPLPASDVVAIDLRVRGAGSAAETAANGGAAHFVEHLVFKGGDGAPASPPGAFDAAFESLGGEAGAQTSRDFVTYSVTVPRDRWEAALALLGRMLLAPAFRPADVAAERAVILNEMAVARGDARRLGIGAVVGAAVPAGDPYRLPLMGTEQGVGRLTPDVLRAFHAAHYRPGRFTLAVAGPVSLEAVRKAAEGAFGGGGSRTETTAAAAAAPPAAPPGEIPLISDGTAARPVRAPLPLADARTAATLNSVFFAFRAPSPRNAGEAALAEVTTALLARGGDEGYLGRRLTASGAAVTVRAEYLPLRRGGLLLLSAAGRRAPDELESALLAELTRLREDGVAPGDAEAAKYARLGQAMADAETATTLAARLAYYDALGAAPDWHERYAERVAALTNADLARAVRDWLAPARRVVVVTGPDAPAAPPSSVAGARR